MATPAEHYRKAEQILADHKRVLENATANTVAEVIAVAPVRLAEAQIHATLAHAGAVIIAERGAHTRAGNDLFDAVTETECDPAPDVPNVCLGVRVASGPVWINPDGTTSPVVTGTVSYPDPAGMDGADAAPFPSYFEPPLAPGGKL